MNGGRFFGFGRDSPTMLCSVKGVFVCYEVDYFLNHLVVVVVWRVFSSRKKQTSLTENSSRWVFCLVLVLFTLPNKSLMKGSPLSPSPLLILTVVMFFLFLSRPSVLEPHRMWLPALKILLPVLLLPLCSSSLSSCVSFHFITSRVSFTFPSSSSAAVYATCLYVVPVVTH